MKSLSFHIDQMNKLCDNLIEVAKNLRDITMQVLTEQEIQLYQAKQKVLLVQIEKIDQVIETDFGNQVDEKDHHCLRDKMHIFQMLNQEYIQNLKKNHGLIQFDLPHPEDQNELTEKFTYQLNKILPSPNPTPTIKSKKTKKS